MAAGSVSLVGFGIDSAIEVSAALILTWRLHQERNGGCMQPADAKATKAIALSFAALAAYVAVDAISDLAGGTHPEASAAGVVLAAVSLTLMPILARAKAKLAPVLGSAAAAADAAQTNLCALLSALVLVGVGANWIAGWWWADPIAGLGIAAIAAAEALRPGAPNPCKTPAAPDTRSQRKECPVAVTALVLYALWFLIAFGLRTAIALRTTGDSGFRGISGRAFSLEWWAGVLFTIALVIGVAAPVADLAGLPLLIHSPTVAFCGLAVALVGIAITLAAQVSMGDSWRIGVDETERTPLVTAGAFALARNPIFTAMAVTAIGLAAMVPNLIAVLGIVALLTALELQVRGVEEPYLREVHGAAYERYAARIGRFVPGAGRLEAPAVSRR